MTDSVVTIGPWTLEVNHEFIDVTSSSPRPDPNWHFTDAEGHEHGYDRKGRGWPSLVWHVTGGFWCDDCADEIEEGEWTCALCSETVRLGMHYGCGVLEQMEVRTTGVLTYRDRTNVKVWRLSASELPLVGRGSAGVLSEIIPPDRQPDQWEQTIRLMRVSVERQ